MMTHKLIPILMILGAATLAAQTDYFPLQTGNQWVYRSSKLLPPLAVEVKGTESINNNNYFVVSGFFGGDRLLRKTDNGVLVEYRRETGDERPWVSFDAREGERFPSSIDECNPTALIQSRAEKVSLPIGNFDNALVVHFPDLFCADAGLTHDVYLPGIGLGKREHLTIAGPVQYELVYAKVGSATFAGPELSFGLSLDQAVYVSPEGGPAPTATARITLRNTTSDAITLSFPSTQRYDFEMRNARDEVVFRWSAARVFAQVAANELITGERNYIERIPLADKDGKPLPPGNYSLEGWITADGTPFRAVVRFVNVVTREPAQAGERR